MDRRIDPAYDESEHVTVGIIPARVESANPESSREPGACAWIPGPLLRSVPE
jgi:hypothetical protein